MMCLEMKWQHLVNEEKPAGSYEVEFNSESSQACPESDERNIFLQASSRSIHSNQENDTSEVIRKQHT